MKKSRNPLLLFGTLLLLSLPFVIFFKAQAIVDWLALRNYTPPAEVSALAAQDTMTNYGTHVFYVNHPDLQTNAEQFRTDCSEFEKTIVLGCYHGNQRGIFVYKVTDGRLSGVQQVTAAHEMLHAAYDRLSAKDKRAVNKMLQSYYATVKDQRIIDTVNAYKQSEPKDVVNEMHSIFGTEISDLPAPLEAYYSKYFKDRKAVANFAAKYQAEFTSRQDQIKADDAQLAVLKVEIDRQESALSTQLAQLKAERDQLDTLRSSGQISQYNSQVEAFNAKVSAYNYGVAKLKSSIAAYNQLVAQRNTIAAELASLSKAIDTRLTTQAAQ